MDSTRIETTVRNSSRRLRWGTLGLALVLQTAVATAQWVTQSPVPTHLEINGVAAPTPGRVYLATADDPTDNGGALFESVDGGTTWIQRDVPFSLSTSLAGVFFFDDQNGWIWGNVNYRTTDGGTSWTELPFLGSAYSMEFYTTNFGLTTGNFGAYVSDDGGSSWTPSPNDMTGFDFFDDQTGLGFAETGIYRTTDSGATFSLVHAGVATAVVFLSESTAVGIVDQSFVSSTDSGQTWTTGAIADGRSKLFAVSTEIVLAWGRSGIFPDYDDRIFRSDDGGLTWADLGEVIDPGPLAAAYAFTVPSELTVVASNGAGKVYQSLDGGQTWLNTYTSPGPSPAFSTNTASPAFADAMNGYFGFGAGFLLETTDGGGSWTQLSSGTGESIADMERFSDGTLIAVGENGVVLTSTGTSAWSLERSFTSADLQAVQVIGDQQVVTVDESGRLYRSSDAGATWTAAATTPSGLEAEDLHFTSFLDGWVAGSGFAGAAVFHTTDGGTTWQPVTDFSGAYIAVDFEGTHGWAANVSGRFYRSTDSGANWIEGDLPGSPLQIRDMDFFDSSVGYAVGWWGYAVRSDDGGASWQTLPIPSDDDQLTDIHIIGPDELWVTSNSNRAYYSATGGQNWAVMDIDSAGFGNFATIVATSEGSAWTAGFQGYIEHFAGPPPPPVNRSPIASYDFVATGLSVSFSDTSVDHDGTISNWLWDFGDTTTTSTEQHPTHVFPGADTYHVSLTVTDDDGATGNTLQFIAVQPGPGGTFGDFTEVTPLDPLFVTPQDEDFWVTSSAPADFDGDGDLDIAVLGYYVIYHVSAEDRLVLLRNDGPAGAEEWQFEYIDVPLGTISAGASDLAWGDVDGDGDQDLAVGSDLQTVIYRNDSGTLVPTDSVLPPYWEDNDQAEFDLSSLSWADFDNDGDLDLLLPSVWDQTNFEYRTALLRNDGANGTGGWSFTEMATAIDPTAHAQSAWADFDGDQDLDLLLVHLAPLTNDGFIRRYRNDGGGVFVGEDLLGELTIEHGQVQWGDFDDDGDLDLLVAGLVREEGTFTRVLRIYRNDADSFVPIEVLECPACDGWIDLDAAAWADYDSDGDMDILLAGSYNSGSQIEGRAKIYTNQGGVFTTSADQLPAPRGTGSRGGSFTWLDLDGEGDLDYFVAGQYFVPGGNGLVEAQMHVYRNDIEAHNTAPSDPTFLTSQIAGAGSVVLGWNPAFDDFTPTDSLTYDLRLYREDAPVSIPRRQPEPGNVSAAGLWTLTELAEGLYTWTLQAVDSAFNSGPVAEATFTIGDGAGALVFTDGFESGDLSRWSVVVP